MKQWFKGASAFGAAMTLLMVASNVHAGWGWHHHSSGGSWGGGYASGGSWGGYASGGSWGSSGGSRGGYASGGSWGSGGSSGGGLIRRVAARIHSHHSGGGSWGSRGGSSGGSWGGYASGGSWGSHGSSGGGVIARIRARRVYHSGGGSWGSHGSSGSYAYASVSYGSSGGGSYGSSGGAVSYASPAVSYSAPVTYESYSTTACENCSATGGVIYDSGTVIENGAAAESGTVIEAPEVASPSTDDSVQTDDSPSTLLAVRVPANAQVFVNGYRTKATGSFRQYRSAGLQAEREYTYEVRAVVNRDGSEVAQTKFVTMKAGEKSELGFVFGETSAKTSLTLHVPDDAEVTLAGAATKMEGATRVFSTASLESGKTWEDYVVRVTVERDGETLTKERTITIRGGEQHELAFNFDGVALASTN